MLETCYLLAELFYFMLEVRFPAADTGVTGLKNEAEAIGRTDRRPPYEAGHITQAAQSQLAGRAGRRSGGSGRPMASASFSSPVTPASAAGKRTSSMK